MLTFKTFCTQTSEINPDNYSPAAFYASILAFTMSAKSAAGVKSIDKFPCWKDMILKLEIVQKTILLLVVIK